MPVRAAEQPAEGSARGDADARAVAAAAQRLIHAHARMEPAARVVFKRAARQTKRPDQHHPLVVHYVLAQQAARGTNRNESQVECFLRALEASGVA